MKKRTIIIVCVIVIVLLASGVVLAAGAVQNQDILWFVRKSKALQKDDTVLLTVNGAEIYVSDVEMELEFLKLSQSLTKAQIDTMDVDDSVKEALINKHKEAQRTRDEIVDDLITNTLLLQEAERQGITVSVEDAREEAREQYTAVMERAETSDSYADKMNYELLLLYMQEMDMTEEQYIERAAEEYRKMLIINKLYETQQKADKSTVSDGSFSEEYIESLFDKAEIEYKQ